MTRLSLAGRRALTAEGLAFGSVMVAAAGAAFLSIRAPAQEVLGPSATIQLTPARAAALVAATSASPVEFRAVGERAKLINASMPFSSAPVEASRPFWLKSGATDYDRALLCLTQAVYYEAGFEPLSGRRAVAQVVLNRMRHPAFPKSVCGVVYQRNSSPVCQFTFVCDGSLYRAPAAAAWRDARDIATAALGGYVEQSVGAATHYHADYVAPRWAPLLTKITKLGAHIFYRWPGGWGMRGAFNGRYIGEPRDPLSMRPPMMPQAGQELTVEQAIAAGPVTDGTVLKRAPNDVGGLLDVSKGWTLKIPGPEEVAGASSKALAEQKRATPPAAAQSQDETIPPPAEPVIASR